MDTRGLKPKDVHQSPFDISVNILLTYKDECFDTMAFMIDTMAAMIDTTAAMIDTDVKSFYDTRTSVNI